VSLSPNRIRYRTHDSAQQVQEVASYTKEHDIRVDDDGTIHVYRKASGSDTRVSAGIADPRPSQLRERLAQIRRSK
jgi:hypothetical protein